MVRDNWLEIYNTDTDLEYNKLVQPKVMKQGVKRTGSMPIGT